MVNLELLLSGMVTALTGFLVSEYRLFRKKCLRRRRWVDELDQIALLCTDPFSAVDSAEALKRRADEDDLRLMYHRSGQVLEQLQTHIADAPSGVPSELIESSSLLQNQCVVIQTRWDSAEEARTGKPAIAGAYWPIIEHAGTIRETVRTTDDGLTPDLLQHAS